MRARIPIPRGLLLDNPVFPVAVSGPGGLECDLEGTISIRSLALPDRRRAAVQLMAGAALAAEFDLWPGRAGFRGARAKRSSGGIQAVFGAFPVSLEVVHARLGGGEAALEATRNAVLDVVAEVCGLEPDEVRPETGLGYFLEGALRHSSVLQERPLDPRLARSLWAYQWEPPSLPDEGEIIFWKVNDPILARRLGGAVRAALGRAGRSALLAHSGAKINVDGSERVLVMVGRHSDDVLAGIDAWAGRRGRAAVVIGEFPPGWDPPKPPVNCSQMCRRPLAVTAVSLDTALRVAEEREGRFDPWNETDRRALTESARDLFEPLPSVAAGATRPVLDSVFRALSLRVEGLDRAALVALSGVDDEVLARKVAEGSVVVDGDRWRLPTPPRLGRDPLHAEIAQVLADDDPGRLVHQALADGETEALACWARSQLDQLHFEQVRVILGVFEPGALGSEIDGLRAESCLAGLDLAGARRAIAELEDDERDPWRLWIDLEDHDDDWNPPDLDLEVLLDRHPRIAAELAIHTRRGLKKSGQEGTFDPDALLDRAVDGLSGRLVDWYSVLREAVDRPV